MPKLPDWEKYLYFKKKVLYKSSDGEYGKYNQHEIISASIVLDKDVDVPKLLSEGAIFWCNARGEKLVTERIVKHPQEVEAKLEQKRQLYCFRCKAEIPKKIKQKKDKDGNIKGRCPSCKRICIFVDKDSLGGESTSAPSTTSTTSATSTEPITLRLKQSQKKLADPNLLTNLIKEVQKTGVKGEKKTILIIAIKQAIRYLKHSHPTSSNLIITGSPGMGKDEVTKQTLVTLVSEKELIHRTDLSDKALTYWGTFETKEEEPEWNWTGKVLYLEDPKEELLETPGIRTMTSGGNKSTTVIDGKRVDLEFKGKPFMIVTSYDVKIDKHGDRRWDYLKTDEREELTQKIVAGKWRQFNGEKKEENTPDNILLDGIKELINPCDVIFPHVDVVLDYIPRYALMRTNINKLRDYISACAILHQYQREKDEKGRIKAIWFDYDVGVYVFNQLEGIRGATLNKRESELVDACEPGVTYTVTELSTRSQIPKSWFYEKHMEGLVDRHIFKTTEKEVDAGSSTKPVQAYELLEGENTENSLPFCDIIKEKSTIFGDFLGSPETIQQIDFMDFMDFVRKREELIAFIRNKELSHTLSHSPLKSTKSTKSSRRPIQKIARKSPKIGKKREEKPSQYEKIQEIRKRIEKDSKAGYKIDVDYLYQNFEHVIIDGLTQSNQLIKQGNGEYVFGGF